MADELTLEAILGSKRKLARGLIERGATIQTARYFETVGDLTRNVDPNQCRILRVPSPIRTPSLTSGDWEQTRDRFAERGEVML